MNSTKKNARPNAKGSIRKNSKRPGKKNYRPERDVEALEVTKADYNDPSWYYDTDKNIGEQIYNYSFTEFVGQPVTHGFTETVPGIMGILLNPAAGYAPENTPAGMSPINQVGLRTFTWLSGNNAKTTQYAPQDVTSAILSIGQVIAIAGFIRRAIGIAYTYNVRNRLVPKRLLQSMGIDADDLYANLAQYRIRYNLLSVTASKIPFPSNINYFKVCDTMFTHVFTDSTNPMAQMYFYAPKTTWQIDEAAEPSGTMLKTVNMVRFRPETGNLIVLKLSQYFKVLEDMLNALLESSTLNYLYSDVIRVASKETVNMWTIPTIAETYAVLPEFSQEALYNIHNCWIMGDPYVPYSENNGKWIVNNDVHSNATTNAIEYYPAFRRPYGGADFRAGLHLYNFIDPNPSLDHRVMAARFTADFNDLAVISGEEVKTDFTYTYWTPRSLGDYYVTDVYVPYAKNASARESSETEIEMHKTDSNYIYSSTKASLPTDATLPAIWSVFDWAPIMYQASIGEGSASDRAVLEYNHTLADLGFFTNISDNAIRAMKDIALYSLFELK